MNKIFQAVRLNDINLYDELISFTNINVVNDYGQNLLQEAIAFGNTIIAMNLIKLGIDLNHKDKNGQTSLHYCGQYKNLVIAEAILANSGDPNIQDIHGNNALWTSVFNARGNYEVVKILVEKGSNVACKNFSNRSPLDFAKQINDQILLEILRYSQ